MQNQLFSVFPMLLSISLIVIFSFSISSVPASAQTQTCSYISDFCLTVDGCPRSKVYCIDNSIYMTSYTCTAFVCRECTNIFLKNCASNEVCKNGVCIPQIQKPCSDFNNNPNKCNSYYFNNNYPCSYCFSTNNCYTKQEYSSKCVTTPPPPTPPPPTPPPSCSKQLGDSCTKSSECCSGRCYGTGTSKAYTCKGSCPSGEIVYAPDAQACCKTTDYNGVVCVPSEGGNGEPPKPKRCYQIKSSGECQSRSDCEWCVTGICTERPRTGTNCPTD